MYILVTIIVLILILFFWKALRGVERHLDDLLRILGELLRRGFDCGFVVIKIGYSNRFIQFRKYINAPGEYGIQFGFPRARWSQPYFAEVLKVCREIDPACTIINNGNMDFLYVECEKDVQKAYLCAQRVLTEVFNVTSKTKLFVTLGHAALWDDKIIDTPDEYPEEPLKVTFKRSRDLAREAIKKRKEEKKGKGSDSRKK